MEVVRGLVPYLILVANHDKQRGQGISLEAQGEWQQWAVLEQRPITD